MQEEEMIQNRMQSIINEFGQLKQMNRFDLSLESLGDGAIRVVLTDEKRPNDRAERVILPEEDISFIGDTFTYPATFSPRSKMFNIDEVVSAKFDKERYLVVTHDNSTERFKVDSKHLREVNLILKAKLGSKFTPLVIKGDAPETNPNFI